MSPTAATCTPVTVGGGVVVVVVVVELDVVVDGGRFRDNAVASTSERALSVLCTTNPAERTTNAPPSAAARLSVHPGLRPTTRISDVLY
jgi:hypothetical protein